MSDSGEDGSSLTDEPVYVTTAVHEMAHQEAANERAQLNAAIADMGASVAELAADTKGKLAQIIATLAPAAHSPFRGGAPPATSPFHGGPPSAPVPFPGGAMAPASLFHGGATPAPAHHPSGAAGGGPFRNGAPGIMGLGPDGAHALPSAPGNPLLGFGPYGAPGAAVNASQKRCDKAYAEARANGWTDTAMRLWWGAAGLYQPKLTARALEGVLRDSVELTSDVTDQLINFRNFTPGAFTPRGAHGSAIPLPTCMRLMADSIVAVARNGVPASPDIAAAARVRVDALDHAFRDLLALLDQHRREHFDAFNQPRLRGLIEALLVKDMKAWVRDVQQFTDEVTRASFYPPDTLLPPAPLPLFQSFRSYVAVGGLLNAVHITGRTSATHSARGVGAGGSSTRSSSKACRQFARNGSCRFGAKCAFQHVRTKADGGSGAAGGKRNGGGGGGASRGGGGGGGGAGGGAAGEAEPTPTPAKKARKTSGSDKGKGKDSAGADKGDGE